MRHNCDIQYNSCLASLIHCTELIATVCTVCSILVTVHTFPSIGMYKSLVTNFSSPHLDKEVFGGNIIHVARGLS